MNRSPRMVPGEFYQLLFPLGIAASVWGVLLWPAYFAGWIQTYPLDAHIRLMVTGFVGCTIVGFLGTALPRLLGTPRVRPVEAGWHGAIAVAVLIALCANRIALADLLTALWWLTFLGSTWWKVIRSPCQVPPPGIPVSLLGLFIGALSALYLSATSFGWIALSGFWWMVARLSLFQGLIWFAAIGMGPFILPRFFGEKGRHDFEESTVLPRGWTTQFVVTSLVGVLIMLSLVAEATGSFALGLGGRAAIMVAYFLYTVPGVFRGRNTSSLGWGIRAAFFTCVAGWILAAVFPHLRIGALHLAFLGGGLFILTIETRVSLCHGGRMDLLRRRMRMFHAITGLAVLTALTRFSADLSPAIRISHFVYAAICWVLVVALWMWWLRRQYRAPRIEPDLPEPSALLASNHTNRIP